MIAIKPPWFFGVDIVFELIFALATIILAIYSYHAYTVAKAKNFKYMTMAFSFIGLGYVLKSLVNLLIYLKISGYNHDETMSLSIEQVISQINSLYLSGLALYEFLALSAWLILIFMSFKCCDKKLISLVFVMLAVTIFFTPNFHLLFYLLSTIFLSYLIYHFATNYKTKKSRNKLLVLWGFVFIALGQVVFMLVSFHDIVFVMNLLNFDSVNVLAISQTSYVLGHLFELVGYLSLLANFILVLRR